MLFRSVDYDRLVEEIHRTILNQVIITSQIKYLEQCDVIVDCSRKEVCLSYLNEYKLLNKPLVIAVTGFTQKELNIIEKYLNTVPIIISGNFSRSFYAFCGAIKNIVKEINHTMDISIVEWHHKEKKDKPSGTAIKIREQIIKSDSRYSELDIPIKSIRMGNIFGRHEVVFASNKEEVITVVHEISSRSCFASGILEAVLWLYRQREKKAYLDFEWLENLV